MMITYNLAVDPIGQLRLRWRMRAGKTDSGRRLLVVCTVRGDLIRVISARDMTKPEREVYYANG